MKKLITLLIALSLLLAACTSRQPQTPPPSSGGENNDTQSPFSNKVAEKYYDYFIENSHVAMLLGNETEGDGFSDAEMAAYVLSELIFKSAEAYDYEVGFSKELVDNLTQKYFGTAIVEYENQKSTVIAATGNITSTGWGGDSLVLVLKDLTKNDDDMYVGVFYKFNFGMGEVPPTLKEDLLSASFDNYGQPSLVTIVFEEKTDEQSEIYLQYFSVKQGGIAHSPYEVYQG